ncbi:MAG: AAA family ATPase, partial [Tannerella sp.]|nr:AAA family ATPase [Tannerella sp.]
FVIIDEYDHFANDLIAMGNRMGEDIYRRMVRANGLVRDFYETLKIGTSNVVDRIFITGISPVMLDDLTSGFNIASNLSLKLQYNEMMGFTQTEVDALMIETGVNPQHINVDMKTYYDGYLFHKDGENRVYNPSMILYFFNEILCDKKAPQNILDENLKTDYGRLQRLATNDKNKQTLIDIIKKGGIVTDIIPKFSIDRLYDDEYFVSLLFYMGLLTIKEPYFSELYLTIPNYSIQTIYWEYLRLLTQESSAEISVEVRPLNEAIIALAMEGDVHRYIDYVSKNAFAKLSDRDLRNFDEKYIQILLLAYLFQSKIYIPMSEYEAVPGFTDIFLQRNPDLPQIRFEWIWEIKYLKAGEEYKAPQKMDEAKEQLCKYLHAFRLAGRPGLQGAAIVFTGKNKFDIHLIKA